MAELGAKMGPRWRQDAPRWSLSGHLEADWGVILGILGGLGGDLCRNGRSIQMSTTMVFWLHFQVLGGLVGGSWGYLAASWREVGLSWAILASSWDKDVVSFSTNRIVQGSRNECLRTVPGFS